MSSVPLMSSSSGGAESRMFSAGMRLWPPASSRASGSPAIRLSASSSERAFLYANGAGFTSSPCILLRYSGGEGRAAQCASDERFHDIDRASQQRHRSLFCAKRRVRGERDVRQLG